MADLRIEKLNRGHNRKDFDCGVEKLNEYLQKYARQNQQKNLSKTYLLTNETKTIYGFYKWLTILWQPAGSLHLVNYFG
jgi:hypothetical protein